jgi:hypothetical protein
MPTQGTQAGLRKDLKRVVDDKIPKDVSWQQTVSDSYLIDETYI